MAPIELFGWFLAGFLMVCFIGSLVFISRKPKLFSESDDGSSKNRYVRMKRKN
ncbi:hypothetical protein [Domibacillus iocasae]|uniref:hypothetical protein n=1 Tax=Domibacillus iocasae TaxID=1714016 RepID=UPI0014718063|nr:hypothetical protein [Domibacillus iocasae]